MIRPPRERLTRTTAAIRTALALLAGCCLAACGAWQVRDRAVPDVPAAAWQRGGTPGAVSTGWIEELATGGLPLSELVQEALATNFELKQQEERVAQARQDVIIARSQRLPVLDLAFDGSRRRAGSGASSPVSESYELGVDGRWEVDVWGRLSAAQRAASLSLAAQEAALESARRQLAADVSGQVFNLVEARQLMGVFRQRLANARQSLDVVESGYRQGLNEALDLYLAQNSVEQERANLEQQRQSVVETSSELQLLLAHYPDGQLAFDSELPDVRTVVPTGLPSDLIVRRADVRQAWLSLLAADASLAQAQRLRFPQLSLVGSAGRASAELGDLLDGDELVWSALYSLSAPLFDGGSLEAREARAAAAARQAEQAYLALLYRAFAQVENAISRAASLREQYNAFVLAEENARAALELALEQYQRGLVTYTTVLESQRRAFDATTTVVRLRNQRLQNRIALHLALGGEFSL